MATRLERLIRMEALIRVGGYPSVTTMCRMFEVQPRTIFQDVKELRESFGLDIRFNRGRNGYFNAAPDQRLPPVMLDEDAAILLVVALELLFHFGGDSFRGAMAAAMPTIIPPDKLHLAQKLAPNIDYGQSKVEPVNASVFLSLIRAMQQYKSIELLVEDAGNKRFGLSRLSLQESGWHVTGLDETGPWLFALSHLKIAAGESTFFVGENQ